MPDWFCESPLHEGDRGIGFRGDRFSKRVTYVRADGAERLKERVLPNGRTCRKCAIRESEDPNQGKLL